MQPLLQAQGTSGWALCRPGAAERGPCGPRQLAHLSSSAACGTMAAASVTRSLLAHHGVLCCVFARPRDKVCQETLASRAPPAHWSLGSHLLLPRSHSVGVGTQGHGTRCPAIHPTGTSASIKRHREGRPRGDTPYLAENLHYCQVLSFKGHKWGQAPSCCPYQGGPGGQESRPQGSLERAAAGEASAAGKGGHGRLATGWHRRKPGAHSSALRRIRR